MYVVKCHPSAIRFGCQVLKGAKQKHSPSFTVYRWRRDSVASSRAMSRGTSPSQFTAERDAPCCKRKLTKQTWDSQPLWAQKYLQMSALGQQTLHREQLILSNNLRLRCTGAKSSKWDHKTLQRKQTWKWQKQELHVPVYQASLLTL